MYTIRKHAGMRVNMANVHNGSYGTFTNFADAIAWAHFKHDGMNNTFVCLDNDEIIYGIVPDGKSYETEAMGKHILENPHLLWSTKHYTLQVAK